MRRKKRRGGKKTFILLVAVLIVVLLFLDSNSRIDIEDIDVYFDNLPSSFDGFNILHVSDVHAAVYGDDNDALAAKINAQEPDIIVVTGDLIDGVGQIEIIHSLMSQIARIAPVYYVTGNHEWASGDIDAPFDALNECGVHILRNTYELIERDGESIILAGSDDPNSFWDMKKPETLIREIKETEGDRFMVFLYHRNDMLEMFSENSVDLVFCGHAHGGIARLPFTDGLLGPNREFLPDYTNGLYTMGKTSMIVSRGLSNNSGFPRFLNNPHIPVVTLRAG